jgi:Fic family protein
MIKNRENNRIINITHGPEYDKRLEDMIREYHDLGIDTQIDYDKIHLYSILTHSTAIEGSTLTERQTALILDDGISPKGKTLWEQDMIRDISNAYKIGFKMADSHDAYSIPMLKALESLMMRNTGSIHYDQMGTFDMSKGDLRLRNVTAGTGGKSYMDFTKVPECLEEFCRQLNDERKMEMTEMERYALSFSAHYALVYIHPWSDGNGRMSRLVMNMIQKEFGLILIKVDRKDREEYMNALDEADERRSDRPFVRCMFTLFERDIEKEIENYKRTTGKKEGREVKR